MNGFYCPTGTQDLSAVIQGANGSPTGQVSLEVADARTLLATNNAAFSNLGGPNAAAASQSFPASFDWGLPFFFGRNVFTAIEAASTPHGSGPYFAY